MINAQPFLLTEMLITAKVRKSSLQITKGW
jgi:hypothetical protein